MRKFMRGVTLTELMIVIVVLSIMITVAYPNYREFAARAKRNEARAALLQIATNQERFYLSNQTYTSNLRILGFDVADGATTFTTETGSYRIDMVGADAAQFSASATYLPPDAEGSKCGAFTINSGGIKTSTPYTDCWTRSR